jgi:hypothetical protein
MRKALFLFLILVYFWVGVKFVVAQEVEDPASSARASFDKSYSQYLSKLEEYKKVYDLYVTAKAQHLRSRTPKSESALIDAGQSILKLRDEVIIYYLDMLMKKYKDTDGFNDETAGRLQTKVDEEVKWYETHILSLPSAASLEDLTEDSKEAQTRKRTLTDPLIYEILLNISYAKTQDYADRLENLFWGFRKRFDVIRADTREGFALDVRKVQVIDRYLAEVEVIIKRSNDKRASVYGEILKGKVKDVSAYNGIIKSLAESTGYQKDAIFKFIEAINEIKTKDVI